MVNSWALTKKSYNQDWKARNNFTEVALTCIWKDEGRFGKRRRTSQEGGTAHARKRMAGAVWSEGGDQGAGNGAINVILPFILTNQGNDLTDSPFLEDLSRNSKKVSLERWRLERGRPVRRLLKPCRG